jgi:CubicO group peptidase (beta-lactamase class C family)
MTSRFPRHQCFSFCGAKREILRCFRLAFRFAGQLVLFIAAGMFCCILCVAPAWGADAVYSNVAPDQPMKEWLLLGPIPAQEDSATPDVEKARKTGYEQDLLDEAGREAKITAEADQEVASRGGEYKWRVHESQTREIDLIKALGKHEFAVGYAAATIESPEAQSRLVGLGSDDAVRVWLNGELVHQNSAPRALVIDNDVFPVKLQKGTNRLLIKVVNDSGEWGFTFRFLSAELLAKRLFQAASAGDSETVARLASFEIDLNATSPAGITAAQIAKVRGYDDVANLLVSKGAAKPEPFDASSVVSAILEKTTPKDSPGIAVLIARDGKVLLSSGFGMADLSHDVPVTPATKFRIGSVTKQFAAAAILKLQEEGKLSVSDKLTKFFPEFPRGDEVTIHHLLTHTSGIKSFTSKPDFYATVASTVTSEQMIDSFKNDPFDFDPGTKFSYNNSGYFLLGAIIEKVSGQSFDDYLRETFFEPLEMHDTGVHTATALLKHEATGYSVAEGKATKAIDWDMSRAGAAGNLYSTVEDLMRWNEGIFGGKILSAESLKAAFTPVKLDSGEEPAMAYGYGWMMSERRGLKTISHSGGLNGWMSQLTRYVDQNTTVVVFHNALPGVPEVSPGEVAELVADAFLWQEMKARPKYEVDESVDPTMFAAYVGRYDYFGAVMDIALEGQQLTAQLTGQPRFPIFAFGPDRFFWKAVDAQIEFVKDDNGQIVSARHSQGGQTFVAKRLAEEKIVEVDEETLKRYVGKYEYPGLGVLTVRRDGGKLLAQMTGQPEFELYAKANDEFFWKVVVAEIKFVLGDGGKVEKAVHKQGGATIEAKKME